MDWDVLNPSLSYSRERKNQFYKVVIDKDLSFDESVII